MYVMDGLTHDELAMHAPSVTNRLGTSCAWLWPLRTEVRGSRPMRAVPISWIPSPGSGSTKWRSEEHTSELQSQSNLVCRLLLEKKKKKTIYINNLAKNTLCRRCLTSRTR